MKTFLQVVNLLALFSFCHAQGNIFRNRKGPPLPVKAKKNCRGRKCDQPPISVEAKNCRGRKCDLVLPALDFGNGVDSISFDLKGNGRKIKCDKKAGRFAGNSDKWVGRCDNLGSAHLLTRGTNDRGEKQLFGSVADMDTQEICQFYPDAQGNNGVKCTPAADFPPFADPPNSPDEVGKEAKLLYSNRSVDLVDESSSSTNTSKKVGLKGSSPSIAADDPHRGLNDAGFVLDLLVVWTTNAECKASSLSNGCSFNSTTENTIRGNIESAVMEANEAYSNSGIQAELRLVHAYRHPSYVEAGSYSDMLNGITSKTDGIMDDVHDKRSDYGADIVALVVNNIAACGIGWFGPRLDLMFSVNHVGCLSGAYVLPHEIGHNMDCEHDRGTVGDCTASGYNYGYRGPQAQFRTIMAYPCKRGVWCGDAAFKDKDCMVIPYFSTSDSSISYEGLPLGDSITDNAGKISESLEEIAGYYPTKIAIVAFEISTDNYPGETTWELTDDSNLIIASGGPYSGKNTLYTEYMHVNVDGSYTLTISDSYGDGICCGYGQGSYTITLDGVEIARGGNFGSSETTAFNGATTTPSCPSDEVNVTLDILTDNWPQETTWQLTDDGSQASIASGGPYPSQKNTLFSEDVSVCVGNNYTFSIFDSYGDGICCGYGQGSYTVTLDGVQVASGGAFGSSESITFSTLCPLGEEILNLELVTDNYPGETSWELKDDDGEVIASSNESYSSGTTYNVEIPVCVGSTYNFTIYDTWGDGICCGYGQGSYTVTLNGTTAVLATGGEFDSEETTSITVTN